MIPHWPTGISSGERWQEGARPPASLPVPGRPAQHHGVAAPSQERVDQTATARVLLGGGRFERRLFTGEVLARVAHFSHDGYRGALGMWEVGEGFTSPQLHTGDSRAEVRNSTSGAAIPSAAALKPPRRESELSLRC